MFIHHRNKRDSQCGYGFSNIFKKIITKGISKIANPKLAQKVLDTVTQAAKTKIANIPQIISNQIKDKAIDIFNEGKVKADDVIIKGKANLKRKAHKILNETIEKSVKLIDNDLKDTVKSSKRKKRKSGIPSSLISNKVSKFTFKGKTPTIHEVLKLMNEDLIGRGILLD